MMSRAALFANRYRCEENIERARDVPCAQLQNWQILGFQHLRGAKSLAKTHPNGRFCAPTRIYDDDDDDDSKWAGERLSR